MLLGYVHLGALRDAKGASLVRDENRAILNDKAGLVALGQLMSRLEYGRTLPRDTRALRSGLFEARLTDQGNEYRLYYAHAAGRAVLIGLHFHRKGGQGAQHRAIAHVDDAETASLIRATAGDPHLSTIRRYAVAVGARVRWQVVIDEEATNVHFSPRHVELGLAGQTDHDGRP